MTSSLRYSPPKKIFICSKHGEFEESQVFPNSLGVFAKRYPDLHTVRFCPQCFYELLYKNCCLLDEIRESKIGE